MLTSVALAAVPPAGAPRTAYSASFSVAVAEASSTRSENGNVLPRTGSSTTSSSGSPAESRYSFKRQLLSRAPRFVNIATTCGVLDADVALGRVADQRTRGGCFDRLGRLFLRRRGRDRCRFRQGRRSADGASPAPSWAGIDERLLQVQHQEREKDREKNAAFHVVGGLKSPRCTCPAGTTGRPDRAGTGSQPARPSG